MFIKRLIISDFRNLKYVDTTPAPSFNVICGPNGSGKTSLIEAIYYLALARSFRTNSYQYLMRQGERSFKLYALVQEDERAVTTSIGLQRERGGETLIKLNADQIGRLTDLVDHICVQLLHPQGVDLITKEAEGRRGFIDWGVYYSDPEFKAMWIQYRKILRQRNALLRSVSAHTSSYGAYQAAPYGAPEEALGAPLGPQGGPQDTPLGGPEAGGWRSIDQMGIWDEALARLSLQITEKRRVYLDSLQSILHELLPEFLPHFKLKFELTFGWEKGKDLRSLLAQNLEKDKVLGYTSCGCHRADLKIKNNNLAAGATLSRGQLKMLVYAMRLAQGMLLKQQTGRACIYLIDDLNSELDDHSQRVLLQTLRQCQHQVFVSNIKALQPDFFPPDNSSDYRVFNLNEGQLTVSN